MLESTWATIMKDHEKARRGSYRVNEIAWSEKVYRVASAESGEMGALAWRGGRKRRCTGISEKSPKTQLPSRGEATERPQAPTSLLRLCSLCLYVSTSDSSARHSLMSFFTSGRGGGSGGPP